MREFMEVEGAEARRNGEYMVRWWWIREALK